MARHHNSLGSSSLSDSTVESISDLLMWDFPSQKSGITEYHDLPTKEALDSDLETFVREVLQNANDQGLDNDEPVNVTFEFQQIDDVGKFLETFNWDDTDASAENLRWHIKRANENEKTRDAGLKRFLNGFDEEELLVLTIHDENTTGLYGSEDDSSSPYGALVKDFGSSEKPSSSSGGSFGLGKTVLWAFSGISTVLFNSTPVNVLDDHEPPRLVGRSILPSHEHEDGVDTYTNHGWFGLDDEKARSQLGRLPSVWQDQGPVEEVAETLGVGRGDRGTGTSIGVVGFRIPGEDLNPDPKELADDFRHAAIKHFWPAISRGDLNVSVKTPKGDEEVATLDDAPGVRPFQEAYEQLFQPVSSKLEKPGDFAKTEVELTVPEENDEVVDEPDPSYDTSVDVVLRQLNPADSNALEESEDSDIGPNHVARLRGAQMIVDYLDKGNVADRGKNFAAVLTAGEAQTPGGEVPTDEQLSVEKFVKRSEPTQHDDWVGSKNEYLKKHYSGTIVREINGLAGERLERELADVVREEVESGDEVPDMDDVAPIMQGRSTDGPGGGSVMEWEKEPSTSFDGESWQFTGSGGPKEDHNGWELKIRIDRIDAEESQSEVIPISSITPDPTGATVSYQKKGVKLIMDSTVDKIEFEGQSDEVLNPGEDYSEALEVGDLTEVRLDVSAEVETGGEE